MSDDLSIGERIGELASAQKMNLKELSRKADIPYTTLYAIVNRRSNRVQKTTLHKIARALGTTVEVLAGTGSTDLSMTDSKTFKSRASHYFESLNTDLVSMQNTGLYSYLHLDDDYCQTKADVARFSEETGLSIQYLLGMEDDASQGINSKLQIEGFDDIEIALCERHIKKFIADDLKQVLCSAEDAEAVATTILKYIGADKLVRFSKMVNFVSDDYRKAASAVLRAGIEKTLIEKGRQNNLRVEPSQGEDLWFDIWATAYETENASSEYTIGTEVSAEEANAIIEAYKKKKTTQE